MRKAVYFKDEDYRLSFLYGNYVTLTNVHKADLDRIATQRLSPLYVSVHATDWKVRQYLMGLKKDDHLLEKIRFLTDNDIEIHAQIVLCPGINDGVCLERTLDDLAPFYPGVRSVAVVPVGLTRHRQNLPYIRPVDANYCREVVNQVEKLQSKYRRKLGSRFAFLADEFYLQAGSDVPGADYYEDFPQMENGVGMTRHFLDRWRRIRCQLPPSLPRPVELTVITGHLAYPLLKREVENFINRLPHLLVRILEVPNQFYGPSVSVSGLLTGQDIYQVLKDQGSLSPILIPEKCLNADGLFLDDWTPQILSKKLGRKVFPMDDGLEGLPHLLRKISNGDL